MCVCGGVRPRLDERQLLYHLAAPLVPHSSCCTHDPYISEFYLSADKGS